LSSTLLHLPSPQATPKIPNCKKTRHANALDEKDMNYLRMRCMPGVFRRDKARTVFRR
jgi:hypothetical protein